MMVYLGLAQLLFLLRLALAGAARLRGQLYPVVLLGLFLFAAFRWQVGCDWSGYYNQYLRAASLDPSDIAQMRDPLWWAILHAIQRLGLPYQMANIASSAVFFAGIHMLARRQPDALAFLVLLFPILIINMPMSGIRQGAAIGLICLAFLAFIDRRPLRFALWVGMAAGFHASALIFLLLLPVASGRYTRRRLALAGLLAIPGALMLAGGSSAELASTRYVGSGSTAAGAVFRVGLLGLTALYFLLFVRRKWQRLYPQDYPLVSLGALLMAAAFLLIPVSTVIADRFGYYLIPLQAMIFARLPYLEFRHTPALHHALPYIALLLVFAVWTQASWHFQHCYLPYDSWLFGVPAGSVLR